MASYSSFEIFKEIISSILSTWSRARTQDGDQLCLLLNKDDTPNFFSFMNYMKVM